MMQISSIRTALDAGVLTPSSVVEQVIAAADAYPDKAVWISRVPPEALRRRARDLEAATDRSHLPLFGIPFAVKDNIDAAGLPTTAACPAFSYDPGASAPAVARLLEAGAILVGKTNLDQFATGLVGTRSPYGAPRSVFSARHVSGGSSSGSAVAVAAGLVAFALGTDTAGSGRVPAGFNNIVGLKPTRGLVSTRGVLPACRTLDCVSVFAGSAADAAEVLGLVAGHDPEDPFSRTAPATRLPLGGFRFGLLEGADLDFDDRQDAALYQQAVERLAALGGTPVRIDYAPFREAAALVYGGPWVAERLAAIGPFLEEHASGMDRTVAGIIGGARGISAADAFRGLYRLRALGQQAAQVWERIDVLLVPTTPGHPTIAALEADPVGPNGRLGSYTNFVNLLDYSAIAVPAGFRNNGLPFGVTLVAPAFADADLAILGDRLHRAAGCGTGAARAEIAGTTPAPAGDGRILLAVAGAHLSGMALNHELTARDARLVRSTRTAPEYRLFALASTHPPKPGLVRTPGLQGPGIAVEIWSLPPAAFGAFVASLPPPMGIGTVRLADGSLVPGFLCESCALEQAEDITRFGGWRAYRKATAD